MLRRASKALISRGLIEYPSRRNTYYGEDDKALPNRSQAENKAEANRGDKKKSGKIADVSKPHEIYVRIKEAFEAKGITSDTGIAEKIGITTPSIQGLKNKGHIKRENLKTVVDFTGKPAGWFLWGAGDTPTQDEGELKLDFNDSDQVFIAKLAENEKVSYENMVYRLVVEALRVRSANLFSDYQKLPPEQLDDALPYVLPANKR